MCITQFLKKERERERERGKEREKKRDVIGDLTIFVNYISKRNWRDHYMILRIIKEYDNKAINSRRNNELKGISALGLRAQPFIALTIAIYRMLRNS